MIDTCAWTVETMYSTVLEQLLNNIMNHTNFSQVFTLLNMRGYKAWHIHQVYEELEKYLCLETYMINHHYKLLKENTSAKTSLVPNDVYCMNKMSISHGDKQCIIRTLFEKWKEWELETRDLLAACVEWCVDSQLADSEKFRDLLREVDKEIKSLENHIVQLRDTDYNLLDIIMLQEEMHDKYCQKGKRGIKEEEA